MYWITGDSHFLKNMAENIKENEGRRMVVRPDIKAGQTGQEAKEEVKRNLCILFDICKGSST
jgi:hypothetical protein